MTWTTSCEVKMVCVRAGTFTATAAGTRGERQLGGGLALAGSAGELRADGEGGAPRGGGRGRGGACRWRWRPLRSHGGRGRGGQRRQHGGGRTWRAVAGAQGGQGGWSGSARGAGACSHCRWTHWGESGGGRAGARPSSAAGARGGGPRRRRSPSARSLSTPARAEHWQRVLGARYLHTCTSTRPPPCRTARSCVSLPSSPPLSARG